jgi:hypothetical protein
MEYSKLFKKENMAETILIGLFIVFLVMGQSLPRELGDLINTPIGTIVVIIVSLSLFAYSNPILAILGVFVAFEMLRRSGATSMFAPSTESKKWDSVKNVNTVQYTLEQEVIKNMAPIVGKSSMLSESATFAPIVDNTHDAQALY